jgi:hypothetical protein
LREGVSDLLRARPVPALVDPLAEPAAGPLTPSAGVAPLPGAPGGGRVGRTVVDRVREHLRAAAGCVVEDVDSAAQLWERAHLWSLVVEESTGLRLRRDLLAVAGHPDPTEAGLEPVVPPFPMIDHPGWTWTPTTSFQQGVGAALPEGCVELAATLDRHLALLARYPSVRSAHRRYDGDCRSLDPPRHGVVEYREEVLAAVGAARGDEVRSLAAVDEEIRSVFPWPPPKAGSWWAAEVGRAGRLAVDWLNARRGLEVVSLPQPITAAEPDRRRLGYRSVVRYRLPAGYGGRPQWRQLSVGLPDDPIRLLLLD